MTRFIGPAAVERQFLKRPLALRVYKIRIRLAARVLKEYRGKCLRFMRR